MLRQPLRAEALTLLSATRWRMCGMPCGSLSILPPHMPPVRPWWARPVCLCTALEVPRWQSASALRACAPLTHGNKPLTARATVGGCPCNAQVACPRKQALEAWRTLAPPSPSLRLSLAAPRYGTNGRVPCCVCGSHVPQDEWHAANRACPAGKYRHFCKD